MKSFSSRPATFAALTLLGLGASTLLSGCFEQDGQKDGCTPKGGTCDTAAVVVDLSRTTGCGLALHLADSTYIIPTGATWANFKPVVGQRVLVGYTRERGPNPCPAGPLVELGCISLNTTATPTTTTAP